MGFEPTLSGLTGRHVNRYTTAPQSLQKYGNIIDLIAQGITWYAWAHVHLLVGLIIYGFTDIVVCYI